MELANTVEFYKFCVHIKFLMTRYEALNQGGVAVWCQASFPDGDVMDWASPGTNSPLRSRQDGRHHFCQGKLDSVEKVKFLLTIKTISL